MQKSTRFLFFLSLISIFLGCANEYEVPNDVIVQDFVWKGLNVYYLHQDQINNLSDRRFNSDEELNTYLRSFPDYNNLFSSLLINTDTKSTLIEDYNSLTEPVPRTGFTNGMEFGIISEPGSTENVIGYVTHILPNSNASSQNIIRGEFFNSVDGTQLTRSNFENLLISGSDAFTLTMVYFDGSTLSSNGKTVSLEKESYDYPAVFFEKTLTVNGEDVGYLVYNNDFSFNYLESLNNTALNFKNQGVKKLVLDLRYSIGSDAYASNIEKLGSILTGQFNNKIFIKEQWNSKAQSWFLSNQPDSILTRFSNNLNENTIVNGIELTDLYIILNGESFTGSSATELLINSLNPHINVHVIGNKTTGNNTGAITLYDSEDYDFELRRTDHTVALNPIVLSFLNKDDQTYENGFTPNIDLCDHEDALNLGVLGELSDPILHNVLDYIANGTSMTFNCSLNNFEYIYNSINQQRIRDRGVFIKQDLPNTN